MRVCLVHANLPLTGARFFVFVLLYVQKVIQNQRGHLKREAFYRAESYPEPKGALEKGSLLSRCRREGLARHAGKDGEAVVVNDSLL